MNQARGREVLPYFLLQGAAALPEWSSRTDSELLDEYVKNRSELAFATLVQRHAPMVWSVCYRFLRHYQDTEDAFQATFLVLAKRAADVQPPELLANWLYGVARHTAQKARYMAGRRRIREQQSAFTEAASPHQPTGDDELMDVLYEELAYLPVKFRLVVILCDIEGRSRKEVARQLQVPEGTVAGWLARARKLLQQRLAKRGATLTTAGVALLLAKSTTAAPYRALFDTVRAGWLISTGQSIAEAVSAKVALLATATLRSISSGTGLAVLTGGVACLLAAGLAWSLVSSQLVNGHASISGEHHLTHLASPLPDLQHLGDEAELPPAVHFTPRDMAARTHDVKSEKLPEPIPVLPKERVSDGNKALAGLKKSEAAKPKEPPRKKAVDDDDDDEEKHKIEGLVSDVNWQKGMLTIQRVQQRRMQQHTYRLSQTARVWHKGKPADITVLTRGLYVELELSPVDKQVTLVKLKPRPKVPDEKKT